MRRLDGPSGVLRVLDQGHDHPVGAGVESTADEHGFVRGDPHDHRRPALAAQRESFPNAAVVVMTVLRIDTHPREAQVLELGRRAHLTQHRPDARHRS